MDTKTIGLISAVSGVLAIICIIASLFVGIVSFALGVIFAIVCTVFAIKHSFERETLSLLLFLALASLIGCGAVAALSVESVSSGEEGVIVSSPLGHNGDILEEGWHFDPIYALSKIEDIRYNTQTSEYIGGTNYNDVDNDGCIMVLSSDALYVYIDMSISYNLDKSTVGKLRTEFGSDWKMQLIHQNVRSIPRNVALQYKALDLATDDTSRTEFQNKIVSQLTSKIESDSKGYINVSNVAIREVRFANTLIDKINEKMNAQQDLERAEIEKQTASVKAESEKQVAIVNAQKQLELAQKQLEIEKANVEVEKTKAEAEAQAIKIKAEADAQATKMKAEAEADRFNQIITEFGSVEAYNEFVKNQNTSWGIVPNSSTIIVTP